MIGWHHDQHAQAEIEDVGHLVIVDAAGALDELEERGNGPGASVEVEGHAVEQYARRVVDQPAAGNVGQAFDGQAGLLQALNLGQVASMRRQQRFAQRPAQLGWCRMQIPVLKHPPRQREAVGVQPG